MYDALRTLLGIDPEELEWTDLALCQGLDRNLFYDDYESDEQVAKMTDQMCLSCPVMQQCLERGLDNGEWGVWGGIYLTSGRPDANRNAHKTQETWDAIRERIGDESL
jgi:hypothetical protein